MSQETDDKKTHAKVNLEEAVQSENKRAFHCDPHELISCQFYQQAMTKKKFALPKKTLLAGGIIYALYRAGKSILNVVYPPTVKKYVALGMAAATITAVTHCGSIYDETKSLLRGGVASYRVSSERKEELKARDAKISELLGHRRALEQRLHDDAEADKKTEMQYKNREESLLNYEQRLKIKDSELQAKQAGLSREYDSVNRTADELRRKEQQMVTAIKQMDSALKEKEYSSQQKEQALKEREQALKERDRIIAELKASERELKKTVTSYESRMNAYESNSSDLERKTTDYEQRITEMQNALAKTGRELKEKESLLAKNNEWIRSQKRTDSRFNADLINSKEVSESTKEYIRNCVNERLLDLYETDHIIYVDKERATLSVYDISHKGNSFIRRIDGPNLVRTYPCTVGSAENKDPLKVFEMTEIAMITGTGDTKIAGYLGFGMKDSQREFRYHSINGVPQAVFMKEQAQQGHINMANEDFRDLYRRIDSESTQIIVNDSTD